MDEFDYIFNDMGELQLHISKHQWFGPQQTVQ